MEDLSLLYKGSVKNIWKFKKGGEDKTYLFEYSDCYSVFDWGRMPDELEGKGNCLASMAWFFFEILGNPSFWRDWQAPTQIENSDLLKKFREKGIKHHSKELTKEKFLSVDAVDVFWPESKTVDGCLVWDYSEYNKRPKNALVPLEVVFRFGVPKGSSLVKRVENKGYCQEIGLSKKPAVGDRFELPLIEYSTKLEATDRYLDLNEAKRIASLSERETKKLYEMTKLISLRLKDIFKGIGVELWDGKFEFAFAPEVDEEEERDFCSCGLHWTG